MIDWIVPAVIFPLFSIVVFHALTYGRRGRRWGAITRR
jgi:hypothetical protein